MNRLHISIRCLSPLSHGAFDAGDIGNASAIRRLPIVNLPGRPTVPAFAGNALRGRMRRILIRDLLDRCEIDHATPGHDRLYAALCNGGHLDGSEQSVNPERRRALREALPPLSVLGAALYKWMLAGRSSVGICWPVCVETVEGGLVDAPEGLPLLPAEDLVHETSHTRHVDRDHHEPDASGVTPMPTTLETLATGTLLQSRVHFTPEATEIERSALAYAIGRVHAIGGKVAGGLGWTEITHDGDPVPYLRWCADHIGEAREALVELAAEVDRRAAAKKRAKKAA